MGSGDVYKRQLHVPQEMLDEFGDSLKNLRKDTVICSICFNVSESCLLYTSDAADDLLCVDLGGRRIIKKKKIINKTARQYKAPQSL